MSGVTYTYLVIERNKIAQQIYISKCALFLHFQTLYFTDLKTTEIKHVRWINDKEIMIKTPFQLSTFARSGVPMKWYSFPSLLLRRYAMALCHFDPLATAGGVWPSCVNKPPQPKSVRATEGRSSNARFTSAGVAEFPRKRIADTPGRN